LVMAYYVAPEDFNVNTLPLDQLTHIIYSFTEVIDGQMKFKNEDYGKHLEEIVAMKSKYPDLKVMIACGGWGGSGGFSDMAKTDSSREVFVQSSMDFVKRYDLDGIDVDWEYPGLRGAGNPYGPEDTPNFTSLMKELREGLDEIRPGMVLTFAAAGWERYFDYIETTEVMKYADFMNLMTYDLFGGNSPITGHHTALGNIELADVEGTPIHGSMIEREREHLSSAENIVDYVLNLGIGPDQLVIGGAFYGRAWKGVDPENNGLYQNNKGVHIGWAGYSGIRANYEGINGFERYWDPVAKAPYLYNASDSIFISYDDTMSVRLKTRYVIDQELGGIMFWQLGNDTKEEDGLLDAIYKEATK